jgi:anion-transporting  ArsA/GET3 family ATPase
MSAVFDVDALLGDARILVCCGSGGVGKTTSSAALALRAAESGRKVVVLTIDPARRLAQSMGLETLDNTPQRVVGVDERRGGSLHAMQLDMKRTFDEIVLAHNTTDRAQAILENPYYVTLSSRLAGTQEYMAMERLGQLRSSGERWDLIVVDTPPSRSALDFLDAPQRLVGLLDGRMIKVLLAPAKVGTQAYFKVLGAGVNVVSGVFAKLFGGQFIRDIAALLASMETMFGGFSERARSTYQLLADEGSFLVVAAPEPDALREASFFVHRINEEKLDLAGLVLNRVHEVHAPALGVAPALVAADRLDDTDAAAAALLRHHADLVGVAEREARHTARFAAAHPSLPINRIRARDEDVHDLAALREVAAELAGS